MRLVSWNHISFRLFVWSPFSEMILICLTLNPKYSENPICSTFYLFCFMAHKHRTSNAFLIYCSLNSCHRPSSNTVACELRKVTKHHSTYLSAGSSMSYLDILNVEWPQNHILVKRNVTAYCMAPMESRL